MVNVILLEVAITLNFYGFHNISLYIVLHIQKSSCNISLTTLSIPFTNIHCVLKTFIDFNGDRFRTSTHMHAREHTHILVSMLLYSSVWLCVRKERNYDLIYMKMWNGVYLSPLNHIQINSTERLQMIYTMVCRRWSTACAFSFILLWPKLSLSLWLIVPFL